MDRVPVQSSSLASVGFEPTTSTMEIEFVSGGIYQYFGVPPEVHEGLMAAGSKGTFLDQHIKKAGYPYSKVS